MISKIRLSIIQILLLLLARLGLAQRISSFSYQKMYKIAVHLEYKRLRLFKAELQNYISGPDGDYLGDKNSYDLAMQEVLSALDLSFVVVESVIADHILVPQCRNPQPRAFVLEYRVVRYKSQFGTLEEQLRNQAQFALDKINKRGYTKFAKNFHHVKEIVKIGIAFYNRSKIVLKYDTEFVNEFCKDSADAASDEDD